MRIIISPAKKMRTDTDSLPCQDLPHFLPETKKLYDKLCSMSYEELKELWKCSEKIAMQNFERLHHMDLYNNLTPAILAYEGIQYQYMAPGVFTNAEFEYVQEGGLNDYVHMLRKPVSKPFTFTVERYVGTDMIPPLPLGAELVLPIILMISPYPNRFDIAKRTFVFTGCTVISKTYGELNAEKSGILTETIVIAYREMVEVTIPV